MRYRDVPAVPDRPAFRATGLMLGLVVTTLLAALAFSANAGHATRPLAADCVGPDAAASNAIHRLLGETSAAAESRARDAMFRLQRARKNCRIGLVTLAQRDYAAITERRAGRYNRSW
jgi:hypothetical protein